MTAASSAFAAPRLRAEAQAAPARPLWLTATVLGALATFAVCYPAWPGHFGWDAVHAYETSITGIRNMVWPPSHAYLFWLSRKVSGGPGALFLAQTFVLFFSGALAATLLVRTRLLAMAAAAAFIVAFVAVPPMLGIAMSQWRDAPTASFAMASVALWLLASSRRSWPLFVGAAVALGCSVSLRYNAFPLFAGLAPLMVARPFLGQRVGHGARAAAALVLALAIGGAWASTQWRLPDLKRVPPANTLFLIQFFDLLGVSACEDRSFLHPEFTGGVALSGAQARELYDPRHAQLAYGPHPGVPEVKLAGKRAARLLDEAWRETIPKHLGCYVAHRNIVFVEQMGMEKRRVFYPVHGAIDPNGFGLKLARPELSKAVSDYVTRNAPELWRRPFLLYLLAAAGTLAVWLRRDPRALVCGAVTLGAFGNIGLLYLIGPAADARYIFPSNVLCAFVISVAVAALLEGRRGGAR